MLRFFLFFFLPPTLSQHGVLSYFSGFRGRFFFACDFVAQTFFHQNFGPVFHDGPFDHTKKNTPPQLKFLLFGVRCPSSRPCPGGPSRWRSGKVCSGGFFVIPLLLCLLGFFPLGYLLRCVDRVARLFCSPFSFVCRLFLFMLGFPCLAVEGGFCDRSRSSFGLSGPDLKRGHPPDRHCSLGRTVVLF